MNRLIAFAMLFCLPLCAAAQSKPCEDLKTEIAKKLDAKGVTGYTLTIVDKGKEAGAKIVGSCGGGTKSILYEKAAPAAQAKPAGEKKAK
jgi:hypothetical protein